MTELTNDHELTGRLSRREFDRRLWSILEPLAPEHRGVAADRYAARLIRTAGQRNIGWFPSLGCAITTKAVRTSIVQTVLESILDTTTTQLQREQQERNGSS